MRRIDRLIVVSDPTVRGLKAAARVRQLVTELGIDTGEMSLVVSRVHDGIPKALDEQIVSTGLPLIATLPEDPAIREFDSEGRPLLELPDVGPTAACIASIASKIGLDRGK